MTFDSDVTAAQWAADEERIGIENAERDERDHRFSEDAQCIRWGSGPDRCVRSFDHLGPCGDGDGNSTATLAAEHVCVDCGGTGVIS